MVGVESRQLWFEERLAVEEVVTSSLRAPLFEQRLGEWYRLHGAGRQEQVCRLCMTRRQGWGGPGDSRVQVCGGLVMEEEKETRGKPCVPLSYEMGAKTTW